MLLALAVFSIIAGTVYSVFSGGLRLSKISEGRTAVYREAGQAFALMARELENMSAYDVSGMQDAEEIFKGGEERISFLLPADEGLKYISYYLMTPEEVRVHRVMLGRRTSRNVNIDLGGAEAERAQFLVRESQDFIDVLAGEENTAEPEIITGNIKNGSLRFAYGFAAGELKKEIRYEETWSQPGIPAKIRVSMVLIDEYDEQSVELNREVVVPHGILGEGSE